MQSRLSYKFCLKHFLIPKNNHWLKRTLLVFVFILFDYLSTLIFCRVPNEEANLYARTFMEIFGIPLGLTLFVLMANLPVYMTLSLDSHAVRLPYRIARVIEPFVDVVFAWFIAGWHFSGGSSWFWLAPDLTRQAFGTFLYIIIAFYLLNLINHILSISK